MPSGAVWLGPSELSLGRPLPSSGHRLLSALGRFHCGWNTSFLLRADAGWDGTVSHQQDDSPLPLSSGWLSMDSTSARAKCRSQGDTKLRWQEAAPTDASESL